MQTAEDRTRMAGGRRQEAFGGRQTAGDKDQTADSRRKKAGRRWIQFFRPVSCVLPRGECRLRTASCPLSFTACRLPSAAVCLLFVCCFLPSSAHAQETVDKMVATVNGGARTDLITYSDLLWQIALQPNTSLANPSSEDLNRALPLVIDQRLILQEAEKLPTIAPTADEIRNARDALVKVFPSAAEFQQRLLRVGLTSEKLDEILGQRVRIEKYLDFRFRNFVVITQKEIAEYYQDVYVPRLRSRSPGQIIPTLEEARSDIERTLSEAKIESDTDAFLDSARERGEIVTLSPI